MKNKQNTKNSLQSFNEDIQIPKCLVDFQNAIHNFIKRHPELKVEMPKIFINQNEETILLGLDFYNYRNQSSEVIRYIARNSEYGTSDVEVNITGSKLTNYFLNEMQNDTMIFFNNLLEGSRESIEFETQLTHPKKRLFSKFRKNKLLD